MPDKKYHRAFGVYGICIENGNLLVINKNGGPYINRYDLPGGSLEEGEGLSQAMKREFLEESGLEIEIEENIGVIDFKFPWLWRGFSDVHHIAVYYSVRNVGGKLGVPVKFDGQDSLGAIWISEKDATVENASPLVLKAFEWLRTKKLGIDTETFDEWKVLK